MIAIRIPIITGYFVSNQIEISKEIAIDKNGIFDIGNFCKISKDEINGLIRKALKLYLIKIKKAQSELIDGSSDRRIRNEFDRL